MIKKKFKRIYIEITNICNLSCSFCPKTSRKPEFMSVELFKDILTELVGHTDYLYFHVMGEPLLHPQIGVFLDLCEEYGYQVNLTTNGRLLKQVASVLLGKRALRQVNISLHSHENRLLLNDYLSNVFDFVKEANCYVSLRLWNLTNDISNEYVLSKIEENFNLPFNIIEQIQPDSGIKLDDKVFLNPAKLFQWPSLRADIISGNAFCYGLQNQVAILVDGTVVPCCLDGEGVISLGNITQTSFEDIMVGTRAQEIIKGFTQGKAVEELCQKCGYRTRFTL